MSATGWVAAVGALLLATSLISGWIARLPMTLFGLYLIAGICAGPWVLDLVDVDLERHVDALGNFTELAMVASLFITGLKLRLKFNNPLWRMVLILAVPAMLMTIGALAVLARAVLDVSWPQALVLAAILAPTDAVLASLVSVSDAGDTDSLRVALSGEAGLNDGTALPILVLGLALTAHPAAFGDLWLGWLSKDVLWSLACGLLIGFALGWSAGLVSTRLRTASSDSTSSDLMAIGLMAITYAIAQFAHASVFLAAFAAGLGLRHAELFVVKRHPNPRHVEERADDQVEHPPAELLVNPNAFSGDELDSPAASMGMVVSDALSFSDTLERILAAALMLVVGAAIAHYWDFRGLLVAAVLFVAIRPLAVMVCALFESAPRLRILLVGWFGIRGVGSLNYLAFALTHGLQGAAAHTIAAVTVTVVVLSVLVHGVTSTPLMGLRQSLIEKERH